ncbi:hypothetical protein N9Y17_04940, partial [Gammaproteobacteria bacterium]|nr:hypothetical protein [Gammaproteobacteria bacterium]
PTSLNKLHGQAFDSLFSLVQCIYLGDDSLIIYQIQQNNLVLKNQDCLPKKGWSLEDKHCYLVIRSVLTTDSIGPDYVDQIDCLTQHPGVSMDIVEVLSRELLPPGRSSQISLIDKLYAALELDPEDFRLRQSIGFLTVGDLVNFAKSGLSIPDIFSTSDNAPDQENSAPSPR